MRYKICQTCHDGVATHCVDSLENAISQIVLSGGEWRIYREGYTLWEQCYKAFGMNGLVLLSEIAED